MLQTWAKAVLSACGREAETLVVNLDGKHLKGSARRGRGDKAAVILSERFQPQANADRCRLRRSNLRFNLISGICNFELNLTS